MAEPLGIIAGNGQLPRLTAQGMRAAGHPVVIAGMAGQCEKELPGTSDDFKKVGVLRVGEWARKFKRMGATQAIFNALDASPADGGARLK